MNYANQVDSNASQLMHKSLPVEFHQLSKGINAIQGIVQKFQIPIEEDLEDAVERENRLN